MAVEWVAKAKQQTGGQQRFVGSGEQTFEGDPRTCQSSTRSCDKNNTGESKMATAIVAK